MRRSEMLPDLPASLWRHEVRPLIHLAIPTILTNFSLLIMHVCDTWMIGRLGDEALAAIAPAALMIEVLVTFGFLFLSSVVIYVAHHLGNDQPRKCAETGWQGILLAAGFGVAVLALLPTARHVFGVYRNESIQVFEYQVAYFRIGLLSIGPALIGVAVANFFIGLQRTGVAFAITATGVSANVVFNYGLIFGHFGFPELGFVGAAWGTFWATVIEAIAGLLLFLSPAVHRGFRTRRPRLVPRRMRKMAVIGLPAGVQGAADIVSWGVLITWLVAFFGTAHQAAASILIVCMYASFMPAEGVALALMTRVGNSIGSGRPVRATIQAHAAFRIIGLYTVAVAALALLFREPIIAFFSEDPQVIAIGSVALVFLACAQVFDALNITYLHALQGSGDTLWPALTSIALAAIIILVGGLVIVFQFPQLQSAGIWALAALYMAVQGCAFYLRWKRGKWLEINLLEEIDTTG